ESLQLMPLLFDARVDAARAGIVVHDPRPSRQLYWDVRRSDLYRATIARVAPTSRDNDLARLDLEAFGNIGRCRDFAYLDHVNVCPRADSFRFSKEGGLALLAVAASESIRGQPLHRGTRTNEHAAAVLRLNVSLRFQLLNSLAYGHASH